MNNPYAVLGLSPDCTDKQLKKAMRQLSKKWHPDMNPGQEAFAQVRFSEVQEAYEEILHIRAISKKNGAYGYANKDSYYRSNGSENAEEIYRDVMNMMKEGNYYYSINLLDHMQERRRTARWYYHMALARRKTGDLEKAFGAIRNAMAKDRKNKTYSVLYDELLHEKYGNKKWKIRWIEFRDSDSGEEVLGIAFMILMVLVPFIGTWLIKLLTDLLL